MVIVKVNRVDKDIDECPAFGDIVIRHFTDKIEERTDLRLRQIYAFVFFDGKLCFQCLFFLLPFLNTLCQHINRLPLFDTFPKVFNSGIGFLDGGFQFPDRDIIRIFAALFGDLLGDKSNLLVRQKLQTFCHHKVFDELLMDDFLMTLFLFRLFTGIIMIGTTGFTRTAVAGHHFFAISAKELRCQKVFALSVRSCRSCLVFVHHILHPIK